MPDNGNDWRKFRDVPRSPLFSTSFNRGGNRRAVRLPGEGGDDFHCTVEPSPAHIRRTKLPRRDFNSKAKCETKVLGKVLKGQPEKGGCSMRKVR